MKNYSVVILGGRGSGKTVFLGSMFHKLSTPGHYAFYIRTDIEKQKRLNSAYAEMAYKQKWPIATGTSISKWEFDVRVLANNGKEYGVCRITYVDYGGGRVTETDTDSTTFSKHIEEADCLLGLIDGQKLFDLMNGTGDRGEFLLELTNICQNLVHGAKSPIQFIVSKWDVFGGKYSLEAVRNALLGFEVFSNVVRARIRLGGTVRLIPVSATGLDFAIRDDDGGMKILPGKAPSPLHVEMPFACILPDAITDELTRLLSERESLARVTVTEAVHLSFWDRLKKAFGGTVRVVSEHMPDKYRYTEKLLQRLADSAERSAVDKERAARETEQQRRKELDERLGKVSDEHSAFEYTIEAFAKLRRSLDAKFPASRIIMSEE